MLADGGDCISDLSMLREQSALFGPVASTATAWRALDAVDDAALDRLRAARGAARARAWLAGAAPAQVVLDVDATLVTAHSEKEGAAPTYKHGFGFHPVRREALSIRAEVRDHRRRLVAAGRGS